MLAGEAVMMNWSNVAPQDRPAYREWHTLEHMVGRLEIPGFRRGRRYSAIDASRDILVWYEVDSTEVLASDAYRARADEPISELRQKLRVTDGLRMVAAVAYTGGLGVGGYTLTLRFDVAPDQESSVTERLISHDLPAVAALGEITGAHLCVADSDVSGIMPAYLRGRLSIPPRWVVAVEGMTLEAVTAAVDTQLVELQRSSGVHEGSAVGPIARDIYQLEVVVSR